MHTAVQVRRALSHQRYAWCIWELQKNPASCPDLVRLGFLGMTHLNGHVNASTLLGDPQLQESMYPNKRCPDKNILMIPNMETPFVPLTRFIASASPTQKAGAEPKALRPWHACEERPHVSKRSGIATCESGFQDSVQVHVCKGNKHACEDGPCC